MTTAVRFDASGDRLRIDTGLWDYNAAYTFCAWVYLATDRAANYQSIFCRYGGGSSMDQVYIDNSGEIAAFVANGSDTVVAGASISTGTWYHVAIVRESDAALKVYLDGSATATISNTRSVSGRADAVPRFDLSTNEFSEWYDGRIAFARVWTAALSNAEINAEMEATAAVKTGAWGDWPLQTDANDDSGNARHFTAAGTVTYSETGPDIETGSPVSVTPAAAQVAAGATSPTVQLGAVTVAPSAAQAAASATNPTAILGAVTIAPVAGSAAATATAPTVILGAVSVTPDPAQAGAGATNPTVGIGGLSITPDPAQVDASASAPTVILGAVTISPAPATAQAGATAPTLHWGAVTVTPAPAQVAASATNPTLVIGVIVAVVTLTARRNFALTASREFTLSARRTFTLNYRR